MKRTPRQNARGKAGLLPHLALGFTFLLLPAVASALDPVRAALSARPIRFERLALEQGLSQSTVLSMLQDSRGYIWLGTEDGLNRFDGFSFKIYKHDPSDSASLPSSFVWAIAEDRHGDLWIGTDGGGLVRWVRATDRFVRQAGISSSFIRSLQFDPDNALWIGTRDAGLDRLETTTGRVTHFGHDKADPSSLSDDHVYALHIDRGRRLWVGTDAGLNLFDPKRQGFARFLPEPANPSSLSSGRIRGLLGDEDGMLWVGTHGGGLNRLDPRTGKCRQFRNEPLNPASLAHDQVRALFRDADGHVWIGTSRGLDFFEPVSEGFVHYRHDQSNLTSLADDAIMTIGQDRGGLLWVGTRLGGVHKWNPLSWQFGHVAPESGNPRSLASGQVTSFAEDRAGRLWVGTFGGGLHVMNRVTREMTRYTQSPDDETSLSSDRVTALVHDSAGTLWVGTADAGLNRLNLATGAFTRFRQNSTRAGSLNADGVMALLEDRQGTLWIGTFGGGLNRFSNHTNGFDAFRHAPDDPTSLSSDRVTSLVEAPDGKLWVGTDGGGLDLFDPATGDSRRFANREGDLHSLPSDVVYDVFVDAEGGLWAGTRSGLSYLAHGSESFETFASRQGLANEVVYGIRSDRKGRLWLSTNNGLSLFDPRTRSFQNYGVAHGLQASEFNFGASYESPSGELFFGGINGFNAFFPERLRRNTRPPSVVLTSVVKGYKPLDTPADQVSSVKLGFRDQVLTFEFAALDYTAPERNRFAYRLEGFDKRWVDGVGLRRATYTNLDPGHYVFRVRAADSEGTWNDAGLAVAVDVMAPPWATYWAYCGYSFLFLGCVAGTARTQQRKLAREAEYARELELRVMERTRELESVNRQLAKASITDSLTGLANRRFLIEYVEKEISLLEGRYRSIDEGTMTHGSLDIGFMMIDLDNFKQINDSAGHAAGDEVLRQVCDILRETCGESNIVIRWGGDEFLVVARDTSAERLQEVAERLRVRLATHVFDLGDSRAVHTTCSIGFACYPFHPAHLNALSWEQVVTVADRALYVAKSNGRNGWVGFSTTSATPAAGLFGRVSSDPEPLVREGKMNVYTSMNGRPLVW